MNDKESVFNKALMRLFPLFNELGEPYDKNSKSLEINQRRPFAKFSFEFQDGRFRS